MAVCVGVPAGEKGGGKGQAIWFSRRVIQNLLQSGWGSGGWVSPRSGYQAVGSHHAVGMRRVGIRRLGLTTQWVSGGWVSPRSSPKSAPGRGCRPRPGNKPFGTAAGSRILQSRVPISRKKVQVKNRRSGWVSPRSRWGAQPKTFYFFLKKFRRSGWVSPRSGVKWAEMAQTPHKGPPQNP